MPTSPPTRTQAERSDQTRTRILEAAVNQFSEKGLDGARTEQIAEAAGVNKALLYYYFHGKEALYSAAIEHVAEGVRATSMAVLDSDASPGERFLRSALDHFDRIHSNWRFQSLMQQEMIRLHRGEANSLTPLIETMFRPLTQRMEQVQAEGIASGELIPVDTTQMRNAALGANVFYFLSAPMMQLMLGKDLLERSELERRRRLTIEYLGLAIFRDREHGARLAARVLAATPMPPEGGVRPRPVPEFSTDEKKEGKRL
jgi:TetR/AcrR family transcriptional regulator